jgi:hypothetical protein
MPTFTVESVVGEPREWEGKYGKNLSYRLSLAGHDGVVELSQKPETPAPKVGDSIEGELVPSSGDFPPKLRRAKPQGGFNGGGGGMSPEREKRIVRQHSQSMGIETLKLAVDCGVDLQVSSVGDLVTKVKRLADSYDGDAGV